MVGYTAPEDTINEMNGNSVKINAETRVCGVIGNPVAHSLSPAMHNAAFAATGLNYVYVAFRVEDVGACLAGMRAMDGFRGLSVTIPHKVAAMAHVDVVDPLAARVGCVNTIVNESGRLRGTITDGLGTLRAFDEAGVALEGRRILFLGAGGAVRAVAFAMAERGAPGRISILGRTRSRVEALAADLRAVAPDNVATGDLCGDLARALAEHDVIIHGTPLGMHGHGEGESCVPPEWLRPEHVVFDMVYRPMNTRLVCDAEAAGCTVIRGLEMLLHQAALQFECWTECAAPTDIMRAALLAELQHAERAS